MASQRDIILVTEDARVVSAVASALGINGELISQSTCPHMADVVLRLEQAPAAAVLVDIDPLPAGILPELDRISRRFGETCFIVVSDRMSGELVLEVMRAGARQFLLKGSIVSELAAVLDRFAPGNLARSDPRGAVITVLSAGGGCGATTIAVNLAHELHLASSKPSKPSLVIDMDGNYGAVGAYLGLQGRYGLADLLTHQGQIDRELLTSTAMAFSEGLHAMLSPASINFSQPATLADERMGEVLEASRRAYAYTVVDAPRISMTLAASLAHESLFTLIVFQLVVKDVRVARAMHSVLSESGIPSGRLVLVVNRHRSRHTVIALDEARKALGGCSPACVRNDFRSTIRGIDYGQPLAEAAPRSVVRRDISEMAQRIIQANTSDALVGGRR